MQLESGAVCECSVLMPHLLLQQLLAVLVGISIFASCIRPEKNHIAGPRLPCCSALLFGQVACTLVGWG